MILFWEINYVVTCAAIENESNLHYGDKIHPKDFSRRKWISPNVSALRGNDAHAFGKSVSSIHKYMFKTGKQLIHFVILYFVHCSFPGGSVVKNLPTNAGDPRDVDLIPGPGRSPGGEHSNLLQYPCLENPHRQRSLVGYSP